MYDFKGTTVDTLIFPSLTLEVLQCYDTNPKLPHIKVRSKHSTYSLIIDLEVQLSQPVQDHLLPFNHSQYGSGEAGSGIVRHPFEMGQQ